MGRDAFRARHFSDQSHRLSDALRSGERGLRRFRRILCRLATTARRALPAIATLTFALLLMIKGTRRKLHGWVAEWSNAHAWKACLPQGNQGSNPCPSATSL